MSLSNTVCFLALLSLRVCCGATEIYAPLNSQILSSLNTANASETGVAAVGNHSTSVFVSPSGAILYVTSNNNAILAIGAKSGKPIKTYTTTYPLFQVFLSKTPLAVSPDGGTLLVGTCALHVDVVCEKGFVEALDIATGVEIGLVSVGGDQVSGIAISADGKTAYVTHYYEFDCGFSCGLSAPDATIPSDSLTAFSLPALDVVGSVTLSFPPGALAIAPGASVAYVGAADYTVGLAEVSLPGLTINQVISGILAPRLAISADGTLLSVGQPAYNTLNTSDTLTFYRVPGLTLIGTVPLPYYIGDGLAADPKGRYAYTGDSGSIYQVDSQSLTVSKSYSTGTVEDLAVSNSGHTLYLLSGTGSSIASFTEGLTQPNHVSVIYPSSSLTFSPNGQILYTTPGFPLSGIVPVTARGTKLGVYLPNDAFTSTAISADGSTLFAAAQSSLGAGPFALIALNAQTGAVQASVPLASYPGQLALSPDGSKVVVNVVTGAVIYSTSTGATATVTMLGAYACAISPSGTIAYVQSETGNIAVVDLTTAKVVGTIDEFGGAIAFSPVAPIAFASGLNGEIAVIDTATGSITSTIATPTVYPAAFGITPDGRYLYVSGPTGGGTSGVVIDISTLQVIGPLPATGPVAIH